MKRRKEEKAEKEKQTEERKKFQDMKIPHEPPTTMWMVKTMRGSSRTFDFNRHILV